MSGPRPARTAFALRDPFPWAVLVELTRVGEGRGYEGLFLPEIAARDALVALGLLAAETQRLTLGTGIVPLSARTPLLTAMAAATVQERSGGRLVLGIGTGPAVPGALDRLRMVIGQLRSLLRGDRVEIHGHAQALALVPDRPVPIWVSALGPRAVRLAGELADGVLLNWCTPERVAVAVADVRAAAEAVGRNPRDVTIAVYVRGALGPDPKAAVDALKTAAAEYASYPAYAAQFTAMGLGAEAERAGVAHRAGRSRDVPDALVRAIGLVGDAEAARERLNAYREAGADLPIVYPVASGEDPAGSVAATLRAAALA